MPEMNRFIQFNNEQINARQMLQYELLAKALSGAEQLAISERQLMEIQPKQQKIALSVFWRHRSEQVIHYGRLSDIYLLSAGFFRYFSVQNWLSYLEETESLSLMKLRRQLVLLVEEFRLIEKVKAMRPGTTKAFTVRTTTYATAFKQQFRVNRQKGFFAEALMNILYVASHEGTLHIKDEVLAPLLYEWQRIYDVTTTAQSIDFVWRIMPFVEQLVPRDLKRDYYAIADALPEIATKLHTHKGVTSTEKGNDERAKDTIEELFRTWHRETKEDEGTHLRFELERGNAGKAWSENAEEGQEGNTVTEEATGGTSDGSNDNVQNSAPFENAKKTASMKKKAGKSFGIENEQVTYEEQRLAPTTDAEKLAQLAMWRKAQQPFVKALVTEIQKRMIQKQTAMRTNLSYGRLNSRQLLQFVTEERPKPFMKFGAPNKPLDAVFGLLIDGSASMMDKMDETKQAVLLFHDVLRQMAIAHEMVCYYEDAFEATKEEQPNMFEWLHKLEDQQIDHGAAIMALSPHEDNRDGFAIRWMSRRLMAKEEAHKFLLIFSDGEPSAFQYANNGIQDSAEAVIAAEKRGITVLHLFLNTELPSEEQLKLFEIIYGKQSVVAENVGEFTELTMSVLRRIITHIINQL